MTSFALVLFGLAFGFYGWLSGLEIGIGLLRFLEKSTLTRYGISLFRPLWLVTMLFAVIGVGSFANFFKKDTSLLGHQLRTTIIIGLACFVIRSLLAVALFYSKKSRLGYHWQNILFVFTSFGMPLSLGAATIYMLTGSNFWNTSCGWLLIGALFLGLFALAGAFVYFIVGITPHGRTRTISRILNTVVCVFVAILVQHSLTAHYIHVLNLPFIVFTALVSLVIIWQVILHLSGQERYMWFYVSVVAIASPMLLLLSNRPYFIYPNVLLTQAYSPVILLLQAVYAVGILVAVIATSYLLVARPSSAAATTKHH